MRSLHKKFSRLKLPLGKAFVHLPGQFAAMSSNGGPPPSASRYTWQVQAGRDASWTDYGEEETRRLEAGWAIQSTSANEVAVVFTGIPGWGNYVFSLGDRFQQVNTTTGTSRSMRRLMIIQQGRPGIVVHLQPEPPSDLPDIGAYRGAQDMNEEDGTQLSG